MSLLSRIKDSRKKGSHSCLPIQNPTKGFTLFELLTAMVISAFMTGIILLIYISLRNAFWQGTNMIGAQEGAKLALMQIREALGKSCPPSDNQDAVAAPILGETGSEVEFWESCGGITHPYNASDPLYVQCNQEGANLFFNSENPLYTEMVLSLLKNQVVLYNVDEDLTINKPELIANFVTSVNFDRLQENALQITVTKKEVSKNAAGQNKTIQSTANQILFFPQK